MEPGGGHGAVELRQGRVDAQGGNHRGADEAVGGVAAIGGEPVGVGVEQGQVEAGVFAGHGPHRRRLPRRGVEDLRVDAVQVLGFEARDGVVAGARDVLPQLPGGRTARAEGRR